MMINLRSTLLIIKHSSLFPLATKNNQQNTHKQYEQWAGSASHNKKFCKQLQCNKIKMLNNWCISLEFIVSSSQINKWIDEKMMKLIEFWEKAESMPFQFDYKMFGVQTKNNYLYKISHTHTNRKTKHMIHWTKQIDSQRKSIGVIHRLNYH